MSLRDAHAHAWQRTREGNSRMPKLFATIAGTITHRRCFGGGLALTRIVTSGAVLNHMRASAGDWEAAIAALCAENNVEECRLDKDRIKSLAPASCSEFCLSCAIVGGIAAQERIKFVTGGGKPMENQFYFDALDPKCERMRAVPLPC